MPSLHFLSRQRRWVQWWWRHELEGSKGGGEVFRCCRLDSSWDAPGILPHRVSCARLSLQGSVIWSAFISEMCNDDLNAWPASVCMCVQEREENVKADVFHAYLSLLKQTRPAQSWLADPDAMEQGDTPLTMLQSQVCSCCGRSSFLFMLATQKQNFFFLN